MPAKGSSAWYRDHRDPPRASTSDMRAAEDAMVHGDRRRFLELLRAIVTELDDGGQAPGHCHSIPGVWDADNGRLSGMPCQWCATWSRAREALKRNPA